MTHRKAPTLAAVISGFGAPLFVVLAAITSPALAATGADTRCDQAVESPALPDATAGTLSIEVVEHTASGRVTPGQLSVDGSTDDGGAGLEPNPGPPRVEVLLRRIFDETRLREPGQAEPEPDARMAPLAIDKSEPAEVPVSESPDADDDPAEPGDPDWSQDDLIRFKRQMYRTDI